MFTPLKMTTRPIRAARARPPGPGSSVKTTAAIGMCAVAAAIVAGCGDEPTAPTPFPVINVSPVISSITPERPRTEVGESVRLTAAVTDAETPISQLSFEWAASAPGRFDGEGPEVRWTPDRNLETPVAVEITLTVVERYLVPSGPTYIVRQNRVQKTTVVHVNNSSREVTELALTFLRDFANSRNPAAYVVRNFTDNCRGKADELSDVEKNRRDYEILDATFRVDRVDFDGKREVAYVFVECHFQSRRRDGGSVEPADGICALTAVYEPFRWWLCTSNFCLSYRGCNPSPYLSTLARDLRGR